MTELKEIIARIKETAVDAGIIMIEGELSGQGLYASRVAISEALMTLDPIGASLRWRDFTPRLKHIVPGNCVTWIRVEVGYFIRQQKPKPINFCTNFRLHCRTSCKRLPLCAKVQWSLRWGGRGRSFPTRRPNKSNFFNTSYRIQF